MRLGATKSSAISSYNGLGNQLWDLGGARPSLDLNFAGNKSLTDSISTRNPITFTRASSGTYVGSDGLIKTATTNLLLRSEEFDNASWIKTACSVTANAITAPNGTSTADKIVEDTSNGVHTVSQFTPVAGTTYTISIYAKAAERSKLYFSGGGFNSQGFIATFNLLNGTLDTNTGNKGSIVSIGNGWYRCVVSFTASGTFLFAWNLADSSGSNNYTGDGTSGIYIWGAQLEQSSTVGEYIPTTSTINSAPRFDHNPTTGESLGLLVEEQRTNNVLQSNGFDTTWSNTASVRTAAQAVSPEGVNNGWKLINDASNANHNIFQSASFSAIATTFSVFVKYLDHRWVGVRIGAIGNQFFGSWDLQNGVVGSATAGASIGMQAYGNGWYRLTFTATLTTAGTANLIIGLNNVDAVSLTSYAGSGTGIYLWGAQLEAGSFPTSYIPTTTATVTRSADVASITGANFSSWYNQSQGTVFAEYRAPASGTRGVAGFNDNTANERIALFTNGTDPKLLVVDGGVTQVNINGGTISAGVMTKSAATYALNDFAFVHAAGTAVTDISGTLPTVDRLLIGADQAGNYQNGRIKRLTYFPIRLPNATLQQITR